nr:zinc finger BED domain-containing protein RICESLEEPER 2-like [Tanacetum cinerariifolium]
EFWYTAEVEEETKTITFLLSWLDEPLSFSQKEFISAIGLPVCKKHVLLPPNETVRAGLATHVTQPKAPTDLKIKKKKIPSSSQPKSPHKVRVILSKKQVAETQYAEVKVATADATKSLEASKLVEEQGNQPLTAKAKKEPEKIIKMEEDAKDHFMEILTVEQMMDEVDKQIKYVQETSESPYDTESKIKVVKFYFTSQIPKLQDQIVHDSDESADYESMPEDDLRSFSGFEDANSDDTQGNDVSHSDHTFPDHNASAECLSLLDHLDYICEEVSSLHSKLGTIESSIIHQVLDGIKSTLPALVTIALQEQLPRLLSDTLREFAWLETELSKTLKSDMEKSVTTLVKSAPPVSDAKLNERKELVVDKSDEKKSEGIISVEDDSDEDDKQSLSKIFKIITLIPDIPNLTPLNTFAKRQGLPLSPELATFGLTAKEKKRKRTEFIKEVFVTENVRVNGMDMNLIPPTGIMPIQGVVINEPELGIFFMNGNTDIGFQREREFHLTPTIELIRLQNQIKMDSEIDREMFSKINYNNIRRIQVKDIVKEVEDYLKTYFSVGMNISCGVEVLIESITTDLECFDDGFATKVKERFNTSLEANMKICHNDFVSHLSTEELAGLDVLGFWKAKGSTFLVLSRMAQDLPSVHATSSAFESSFSTSRWVLSIRRIRLTLASLEMRMCLKDHLDATAQIQYTSNLENSLDFEEQILDEEVLEHEAVALSDEEIALDEAASEARSNESG